MKDQYLGDRHDLIKYAILRRLTHSGGFMSPRIRTAVCWMKTAPDNSKDGRYINYLCEPMASRWKPIDPPLFNCLRAAVWDRGERKIQVIEKSGLLGDAVFYRYKLTDDRSEREAYFRRLFKRARRRELIFFDPDMGMEVTSKPYGRKKSSQYLYRREVTEAYKKDHSLLIFQHSQRKKSEKLSEELASAMLAATTASLVYVFVTSFAALALVPHERHAARLAATVAKIKNESCWGEIPMETKTYPRGNE